MAPKIAQTQSSCETSEGITTIRRLLNGLHRPRAGLQTSLFFEEAGVHSLGLLWTFQVPIAVENNMPKENWFTLNPFLVKADIFYSKCSSTSDPIIRLEYNSSSFKSYETSFIGFIPFAKKNFAHVLSFVLAQQTYFPQQVQGVKLEWIPLVEALHNFDDVAMGPFLLTHLYHLLYEMTRVLRRYLWFFDQAFQDVFGENATAFYREKFISCIQPRDLAWGVRSDRYEHRLEVYHPNFCSRQLGFRQETKWIKKYEGDLKESHDRLFKVDVGLDEEVANTFVLQEAVTEAERQGAGEGGDVSKLFGDSEGPQATKKPTIASKEEPLGVKMHQKANDLLDTTLKELEGIRKERISQPDASSPSARTTQAFPPQAKSSKFNPKIGEMLHFVEDNSNSMIILILCSKFILLYSSSFASGEGLGNISHSLASKDDPPQ
ncbi:hypothetical protein D8674_040516 [Pyrus ussuriensis x Pyrus communis]|uniref:Uncharacterized protein n=1 Tax=Pyrus ussuriensis x Pyrus communis TaxID=2448454 RepID=A0A5N5FH48_9ROSA|nr:hypothetical protein D8674_040516 [Pyrus ussuriensis x Pyrus communis]